MQLCWLIYALHEMLALFNNGFGATTLAMHGVLNGGTSFIGPGLSPCGSFHCIVERKSTASEEGAKCKQRNRVDSIRASKYSNDIDPSKMSGREKRKVAQLIMEQEHVKLIEQVLNKVPLTKALKPKERTSRSSARDLSRIITRGHAQAQETEESVTRDMDDMDREEPTHINKVRASAFVIHKGDVHVILSSQHVAQARSRGHYKVKMRNLANNKEVSHSFPDGTKLDVVVPNKVSCVYKGIDPRSGQHLFQSDTSEYTIPKTSAIQTLKYVKKDLNVTLSCWKGEAIGVFVPYQVQYKVTHVNPGNYAATLENGLVVMVPSYIKQGDYIDINTAKGEFLRRSVTR